MHDMCWDQYERKNTVGGLLHERSCSGRVRHGRGGIRALTGKSVGVGACTSNQEGGKVNEVRLHAPLCEYVGKGKGVRLAA